MRPPYGKSYEIFLEMQAQETDECVLWPYATNGRGYGKFLRNKVLCYTHRLSCEMEHGLAPFPRAEAAHSCRNRHCFNPRHLRWATRAENAADTIRDKTSTRGSRQPTSKLTEYQVREMRIYARSGVKHRDLATYYGVSYQTISQIMRGKRWGWLA